MKNKRLIITATLLCLSVAFIVAGVIREEHLEVLRKAVNICLECIGIG
ncbi:MAG: hypothetical protein IJ289_00545 [Clostridia bacterium]|nr:hypothetical protein [Clostridia bacterium]